MDLDMFRDGGHFNFLGSFDDFDGIQDLPVDHDFESCTSGDLTPSSQFCDGNMLTEDNFLSDDIQRIMGDWQQLVNAQSLEDSMKLTEEELQRATIDMMKQFDENTSNTRNIRAGIKKIDVKAQKYIIDEDDDDGDVDVETISEGDERPPVIEAGDLNTLLEQFEATELPELPDYVKCDVTKSNILKESKPEVVKKKQDVTINTRTVMDTKEIVKSVDVHPKREENTVKKEINEKIVHIKKEKDIKSERTLGKANLPVNSQKSSPTLEHSRHKQIVDALPQELINRIRESGKRKPISVIPPIAPNKKQRTVNKNQEICKQNDKTTNMIKNLIYLDHDYCNPSLLCLENQKKDSGFESAEEEEHRMILSKQPMVKNADGKLMVSLLKVNTIRNEQIKKKTLNLDEYKKRREGFLKTSQNSSRNNSPFSSTCSSPLPEDEQTRLRKHQEKLERMAMEVLNAQRKVKKEEPDPPADIVPVIPEVVPIPPNIKMITLVSIGVNTDLKSGKNLDPLSSVEQLEQIKPLLEQVSHKISCNSLITSVIENIPKVINSCEPPEKTVTKPVEQEHGEDKTIVYLQEKEKKEVMKRNVGVQTNISLIPQIKASRYRRRMPSRSSNSSESSREGSPVRSRYDRWHKDSGDDSDDSSRSSSYSRSSSSSSYTSSSSNSRTRSRSGTSSKSYSSWCTNKRRDKEYLREVEERRVVYVGRLPPNMTRDDLRRRFQRFGPITSTSLHARDRGDNYGFVTFANKLDAYEAIEHGNDDPYYPKYDLSFGGRRIFCQTTYSDLDNVQDEPCSYLSRRSGDSFDALLREVQEKLRKRKA